MKIKYMGTADRRVIPAGDTFSGRLATPLPTAIVFDWDNHHTIDSETMPEQPDGFWVLMQQEPGFQDVTDLAIIPYNDAERLWQGKFDPTDGRFAEGAPDPNVQYNESFPVIVSPPPTDVLGAVPAVPGLPVEPDPDVYVPPTPVDVPDTQEDAPETPTE